MLAGEICIHSHGKSIWTHKIKGNYTSFHIISFWPKLTETTVLLFLSFPLFDF